MPPERTPLGNSSGNRQFNHELTPYQRGIAIGMQFKGAKIPEVTATLNCSRGAIRSTFSLAHLRNDGESQLRMGGPKCYTEADERLLLRHVRAHPKDNYPALKKKLDLGMSKSTVDRVLKKHGIHNWRARRRPFLTEAHVAKRLAWCLKHRGRNKEEWGMYMWSDECSVERGRGKQTEWVFRTANQVWDKSMIQTYDCNKNMKIMVWGCFWDTGRTNLYIMDRDFESAKHGYSANSYLEVLNAEVKPAVQSLDPGYIFMQDNASIHRAIKVRNWFQENGIE